MIHTEPCTLTVSTQFDSLITSKNCWLIILHASRIPPHVGLIINGTYSSLTIKGHELNVSSEALLKTISQKKIETIAIQFIKQPVFSLEYQKEIFEHHIRQFKKVEKNEATCLSPVKLFLEEFYALPNQKHELLFDVIQHLKQNHYIYNTIGFNVDDKLMKNEFSLPFYTNNQLQSVIEQQTHFTI
jgi:hypothetical protein